MFTPRCGKTAEWDGGVSVKSGRQEALLTLLPAGGQLKGKASPGAWVQAGLCCYLSCDLRKVPALPWPSVSPPGQREQGYYPPLFPHVRFWKELGEIKDWPCRARLFLFSCNKSWLLL